VRTVSGLFDGCEGGKSPAGMFIVSLVVVHQCSKVLITLTLAGCRDTVLKPCHARQPLRA
jgi:hypothetical protein